MFFGCIDTKTKDIIMEKLNALHPPIDGLLMNALAKNTEKKSFWRKYKNKGWSNFKAEDYKVVIEEIRGITKGELWKIENYWSGYQD